MAPIDYSDKRTEEDMRTQYIDPALYHDPDGVKKVWVYIVLDKKEQLNQPTFIATLPKIIEVSEKTAQFLYKSF